jgi:hypothetical protein
MNNAQEAVPAGFDLENLDAVQDITHNCTLISDEDGEPLTGFILAGKNSDDYTAAIGRIRIDNIMRAGKRKQNIDTATEEGAGVVAKTVARNDRATALAVIVGWFGFRKGGKLTPFDKDMLPTLLDKFPQWQIKVLADIEVEANFMPASSKA